MNIRFRAVSLAAALVLGVAIVGMSTGQAEARPRYPRDAGARCVLYNHVEGEDVTFYLPGSRELIGPWGQEVEVVCGSNGQWYRIP